MSNVSELKSKGLTAASWNFFNLMVNQLRTFIVSLVLARLLTPADFGLVSMAMVLNTIIDCIADFGFSGALVRKKSITSVEVSTIFWLNIGIGAFCSFLVFVSAPGFVWFYNVPSLKAIVHVTSLSFLMSSFGLTQTALFQRELNFKRPFQARLISGVASGVLGIILAFCGFGAWAIVLSNLAGWLLYSVAIWFMSSWRPKFVFKFSEVSELVTFGWKMTVTTFINRIIRQLDTFIVGKMFSAASLGLFNRAQSLNNLVVDYSFSSIRGVMLPTLSRLQDDHEAMRYTVIKLINVISFLTFLVSGIMYICASDIILFLFGNQWVGSIEIFKIIGLFSISLCLPIVFDTVMSATNRMTLYLWINILCNVIVLIAISIGLVYGLVGYVWAVSIAGVIKFIPCMISTKECIQLSLIKQISAILRYAILFILSILLCKLLYLDTHYHLLNIVINGGVFTIIYVVANLLLRNDGVIICWNLAKKLHHRKH